MSKTRKITRIVVHCSDSPDSMDIGVKEIRKWHVQDNGWSDVGYHAVCRRDGTIEIGRPEEQAGAHVAGHNVDSLAVCLVGRKDFSPAQMLALVTLVRSWMRKYNITAQNVLGHTELDPKKSCPNLPLNAVRKAVA